jgi:thioredoxin-related protein
MKFLVSFLISSLLTSNTPVWLNDFSRAKTEAATSGKYILINFSGSDWCGPCIRLHKDVFESETFMNYAQKNLVLVNADFPRLRKNQLSKEQQKLNDVLADKYNPQGHFPYTVLVDANGKAVKIWDGYPNETPDNFLSDINGITSAVR